MGVKVQAIVTDGRGGFSQQALEIGEPQGEEVLVEIRASGVCHTDLDTLTWGRPLIMGHEGAGVVQAVGPAVVGLSPGHRVLLNWAIPCGRCVQCGRGAESLCEDRPKVPAERYDWEGGRLGPSFGLGTMATHAIVPQQAVVKIDVEIPFASAAILGCGVMTGFGSVVNVAKVTSGASVVVLGVGGVGLSCVQGAVHAGADPIVAIDVNPDRLAMAAEFGATHMILARREDTGLLEAAGEVRALLGRGADFAFECTAVPELGAAPLAMISNGGMAVAVSGIEQVVPIDMRLFEFDKTYINPLYGQLYANRALKLDEMITRTYPLTADGLLAAFSDMKEGRNAKGVLVDRR
jgi:S-(hydroxymethyl)glutathione dehydrogenase/alcohol dehydrogenase